MSSDKQLLSKVRQRNAVRLNASKVIGSAKNDLEDGADLITENLQNSLIKLNDYRTRLQTLDSDISVAIDDEDKGVEEAQTAADFDDKLLNMIAELSTKVDALLVASVQPQPAGLDTTQQSFSSRRAASVKLPKLHIAKFGGDPLRWAEFWDSFDITIHQNDDLSEVDKFKYLRGFVVGDALRLIDGYRLTTANYSAAIDVLTDRFGNKQLAIFSHFEAMLALPVANHDIQQLQQIYDDCEKHIRSLVSLGLPEETFSQVFTPIILSKLPVFVKMELHRKNGSNPWELSNLRSWLKEEIRARDYSLRSFGGQTSSSSRDSPSGHINSSNRRTQQLQQQSPAKSNGKKWSFPTNTSSSLVASESRSKIMCDYCGENHFSDQCKKFPDVQSRKGRLKGRCFACLSDKHPVKGCQRPRPCAHCGKTGHHRSLCYDKFGTGGRNASNDVSLNVAEGLTDAFTVGKVNSLLSHGEQAMLQTAIGRVVGTNPSIPVQTRMLFDTGCSRTYITSSLATKIAARPRCDEVISVAGFADTKRKTIKFKAVEFDVIVSDGSKQTITANVIPTISCPVQKLPIDLAKYPFIKQMSLADPVVSSPEMVTIDILIGTDYYYDFIGTDSFKCSDGVVFLSSSLGYIITGRIKWDSARDNGVSTVSSLLFSRMEEPFPETNFHVERYWSLEDIGIKAPSTTNEDELALQSFNSTVQFEGGRYQVAWPWKHEEKELPTNYNLSLGRLKSLIGRIGSDEKVLQQYNQVIVDQCEKGVIEEAPGVPSGDIHYVPHHCVITQGKITTKIRVVYDASAKASKSSMSLNECLLRGPVMLDDLCGLLLRFRLNSIGLVSDLEKAFLQVGLQESSRDVTRFLWLKNILKPPSSDNLVVYRFCRVVFGFISSPFLLAAVINHHVKKSLLPVASHIIGNIYVDNVITGKNSYEEAKQFYSESKQLFQEASMNLREWYSNCDELLDEIKPADRGQSTTTKVLGLLWDTSADSLSCSSFEIQTEAVNTKRLMLKYLAKVFDPCGLFSAVTVSAKLLIQKLWKAKFNWDEKLPDEYISEWLSCAESLKQIPCRSVPRCVNKETCSDDSYRQLHCFCDASAKAYAAVVYLVVTSSSGTTADIVFSKSRVGPTNEMSIPRLELMAMVVGVRILLFVETEMRIKIHNKVVWSDSQCVLHWLHKQNVETRFVQNRVAEIRLHEDVEFRYIQTESNPADLPSRGCTFETLTNCSLWWHGPRWLLQKKDKWPVNPITPPDVEKSLKKLEVVLVSADDSSVEEPLLKIETFSSLQRLLRVTAWIRRFAGNCRKCRQRSGCLLAEEIAEAQLLWERNVQLNEFAPALEGLKQRKEVPLVAQLGLFVDENGVLRCRGRLENADLTMDAKYPKLLPKNNRFTQLVIADCHERLYHAGVSHTLAQLRYKYWIVHGRSQVKMVVNRCRLCKILYGGPYRYPESPPLPQFRVNRQRPFSCTGVDYMGPLFIKSVDSEQPTKVWICLYTCSVVRAVHLEVMSSLSTNEFLLGFRRFIALYGKPDLMISDNAKHFHTTNNFFKKLWRETQLDDKFQDFVAVKGITWKFITELAPWMGGFYERMVGVTKKALKSSLNRRCVSLAELQTVVVEVSSIVNSRPLVTSDLTLDSIPLTPSHFLGGPRLGVPSFDLNESEYVPKPLTSDNLLLSWRRLQNIVDSFWKAWQSQYLLSLRSQRINFNRRNTSGSSPEVGSVVLVKEPNLPRCRWRIGRITAAPRSRDGVCRSAIILLPNNNKIQRPINLLYPLEIRFQSTSDNGDGAAKTGDERLVRKAATRAKQRIKQLAETTISDMDSDSSTNAE